MITLLKTSTDIVCVIVDNIPRQVVLKSLKYDCCNRPFHAKTVDCVIAIVCRIRTVYNCVSAPDIPAVKDVTVSTQADSNKGTIDVVWEVSNMCLNLTKPMLPRRYCKRNDHFNL